MLHRFVTVTPSALARLQTSKRLLYLRGGEMPGLGYN
jgi:hypothetical protein